MKKITDAVRVVSTVAKAKAPVILTGVAVVGVVTTAGLAWRLSPHAKVRIEQASTELSDDGDISISKKLELTWDLWLPVAASGTLTIGAVFLGSRLQSKRLAAVIGAYSIAETALQQYEKTVLSELGESAFEKVADKVASDRVLNDPPPKSLDIPDPTSGQTIWYDAWSGRYFTSDIETVRAGVNRFNKRLLGDMWLSLNELYSELNQEPARSADIVGWTPDDIVELDVRAAVMNDSVPVMVLDYQNAPRVYPYDR